MTGQVIEPKILELGDWIAVKGTLFKLMEIHESVDSPARIVFMSQAEMLQIGGA